MLTKLRVYT